MDSDTTMASAEWKKKKRDQKLLFNYVLSRVVVYACMSAVFNLLVPYPTVQASY